ncbi:unnamed protein product [Dovyalis caffra]|uniref:LAGLIDADG homing endonuclease n=1 Tax=Dovyalis caffra TaxID=77055 RepID=A0AAV1SHU0_9ROSI|nr:unnamed protein product [Dovyalis caffra]
MTTEITLTQASSGRRIVMQLGISEGGRRLKHALDMFLCKDDMRTVDGIRPNFPTDIWNQLKKALGTLHSPPYTVKLFKIKGK